MIYIVLARRRGLRCPKCGSSHVRGSHSDALRDSLMDCFSLTPLRCRSCRHRFYARAGIVPAQVEKLASANSAALS